jgi:integrase
MSVSIVLYKNKPLKTGKFAVRLRLYFGKKHYISLGESASIAEWNNRSGRFNAKADLYEEKNAKLRKVEHRAREILNEMETFSFPLFKKKFFNEEQAPTKVGKFLLMYAQEFKDKGKFGNGSKYQQLWNILQQFKKNAKDITFQDIEYNFLNAFEIFLAKRGIKGSTIHFYMRQLRATVNEAIRRGIVNKEAYPFATQFNKNGYSFAHLKGDYNPKPLTLVEVDKLKHFPYNDYPQYQHSYDIFMFLLRGRGLNFVDAAQLTRDNIIDGRLKYVRQKTGKMYSIAISPEMWEIINKYQGSKYIFPIMDTASKDASARYHHVIKALKVFNAQLKHIGMVCGIEKSISSYTARYTYTNILVKNNVGVPIIQQALGHSSIATTQHYIQKFSDSEVDKVDALI